VNDLGAITLVTWAMRLAMAALFAAVCWAFFAQLKRIDWGQAQALAVEIAAGMVALTAGVLLWLGAESVGIA
jgi:hypothetical protein